MDKYIYEYIKVPSGVIVKRYNPSPDNNRIYLCIDNPEGEDGFVAKGEAPITIFSDKAHARKRLLALLDTDSVAEMK